MALGWNEAGRHREAGLAQQTRRATLSSNDSRGGPGGPKNSKVNGSSRTSEEGRLGDLVQGGKGPAAKAALRRRVHATDAVQRVKGQA